MRARTYVLYATIPYIYIIYRVPAGARRSIEFIVEAFCCSLSESAMIALILVAVILGLVVYYLLSRARLCQLRRQPISKVLAEPATYDMHDMESPTVTGFLFKMLIYIAFSRLGQWIMLPYILKGLDFAILNDVYLPEEPTLYPNPLYPPPISEDYAQINRKLLQKLLGCTNGDDSATFRFATVADFRRAYESGKCTPTDVASAVLNAIESSNALNPPLRAITDTKREVVLAMAEASTERWKTGKILSFLDGIPISIKGEYHMEPYDFLSGCVIVPDICKGVPEAVIVCKLKEAGAVMIGVANLQEFGTGTLGSNPNRRHLTARNPYNTDHYCGGSSSGSGACVAAGLCPISIGTDGGGSVRIPAAICGVVGLKHTFGLVDMTGCCKVSHTVGVSGPLCSSVLDAAIAMDVIARETDGERVLISLEGIDDAGNLNGLKVGVYWDFFNNADEEIVAKSKTALQVLESLGVEVVDITIPELESTRVAHFTSIVSEMSQSLSYDTHEHFSDINLETLVAIGMGLPVTSNIYLNAQKQRTRAQACLKHVFQKVDVIVTPATACVAPPIPPAAVPLGELDSKTSGRLMQYSFLANLCGNPALAFPVGYTDDTGFPIGIQILGRAYEERVLLRIGLALEQSGHFPTKKPKVFYNIIEN